LTVGGINDPAHSAKKMLLNPNLNISGIAYSVGFQSLTQFKKPHGGLLM
jgi:transcriptional regulator GlxA family with amidase domain